MSTSCRYFPNSSLSSPFTSTSSIDIHFELLASLTRLTTYNPPVHTCSTNWSFSGLYGGPTSIAYLFYRLSQLYPDLSFRSQSLHDWAEAYLELGQLVFERKTGGKLDPTPENCGIANEVLAALAVRACVASDVSLVGVLCGFMGLINGGGEDYDEGAGATDEGSNEWLYGRAGYLYLLRICQAHDFGDRQRNAQVANMVGIALDHTVSRILRATRTRPWAWQGVEYLGAAHGWIGILCQIVLSSDSRFASEVVCKMLPEILDLQLPDGNFPTTSSREGKQPEDELVQFCHGAPGYVLSLQSIRQCLIWPETGRLRARVDEAIEFAQKNIWEKGLLKKEPSLCHGIAGNALALEERPQFEVFLEKMSSQALEQHEDWMAKAGHTDDFVGLFTGEAGRAWLWAVADKAIARTCIGYNDL